MEFFEYLMFRLNGDYKYLFYYKIKKWERGNILKTDNINKLGKLMRTLSRDRDFYA